MVRKLKTRCGKIALVGQPNAGKSTLMNRIIGRKISIVTHKVQTTRQRICGIAQIQSSQIIFIDTPGLFSTVRYADKQMINATWSAVQEADIIVFLFEAHRGHNRGYIRILKNLSTRLQPPQQFVLGINKIDRVESKRLLKLVSKFNGLEYIQRIFMISGLRGYGVVDFQNWLSHNLPIAPYVYPIDQISDMPEQLLATEVTLEKLLLHLHQELPYTLKVEPCGWQKFRDGSLRIEQEILVTRDGHRGIVIGSKGQKIKAIGSCARLDLQRRFGCKVHLFLKVKVGMDKNIELQNKVLNKNNPNRSGSY